MVALFTFDKPPLASSIWSPVRPFVLGAPSGHNGISAGLCAKSVTVISKVLINKVVLIVLFDFRFSYLVFMDVLAK
jgi:hypothetical protein